MTVIESTTSIIRPVSEVYQFLADMNNHQQLMPDNIINWSSTADEAKFAIENMATLSLKIESRIQNTQIRLIPAERPPFDMELTWNLAVQQDLTEVQFIISADLSVMMKLLAKSPLEKLADHQTRSLNTIFS